MNESPLVQQGVETEEISTSAFDSIVRKSQYPLHTYRSVEIEKAQAIQADNLRQSFSDKANFFVQDDVAGFILAAHQLDWDTNYFGFGVGKIELVLDSTYEVKQDILTQAMNGCLNWARNLELRTLSLQIDTSDRTGLWLARNTGFFLVDTIACYLANLSTVDLQTQSRFIRSAHFSDQHTLYRISADCFGNPRLNLNRFNADPLFDPADVRKMYGLWAQKSVQGILADQVFLYESDNEIRGFITVRLPSRSDIRQGISLGAIPLNAVRVDCQRQGVYTELVQAALLWLREQGVLWAEVKTQLQNIAVHRTWQKIGAPLAFTHYTLHKTLNYA